MRKVTGSQGDDTGVMESDRGRKLKRFKFYQKERDRETGRQGDREREREREREIGRRKKGSGKVKRSKKENRDAQREIKKWSFFGFLPEK